MTVYTKHFGTLKTPQTEPIPGKDQVENSAGGFVFQVSQWDRLDRFLILGSEGGTYYVGEKKLTVDNAKNVLACIQADGKRAVDRIVEISDSGRAPKNDPAIFALAMAASLGSAETKAYALSKLDKVCRIGTHLFQFAESVQSMRGWGRGLRRAIGDWYTTKSPEDIAYQCAKYQQRNGWSHRDLLRLAKPKAGNSSLLRWVTGKPIDAENTVKRIKVVNGKKELIREDKYEANSAALPKIVLAFEEAKRATTKEEVARIIRDNNLPRECVPTQWLNSPEVWDALLEKMPLTAMVRNLGKMTNVGVLAPMSDGVGKALLDLASVERIQKSRLHPLAILMALRTYATGHGEKGKLTWNPVPQIVDALNGAFYHAFANVVPTNKRWLLGLDVSGSMASPIAGTSLSCAEATAAMALVTAQTEPQYHIFGFCHQFTPLPISKGMRLDDAMRHTRNHNFGGTNCSLPMTYALSERIPVDVFAVYTDSESFAGNIHASQALIQYREKMGIAAKAICVGMTATEFTILDPQDSGSLNVVGFDSATPQVIGDFVAN
jgi:60 kDa SS-A/Ro ribonucleoprotein